MDRVPEAQLRALIPPRDGATFVLDAEAKEGQPVSRTGRPFPYTTFSMDHAYIHLVPGDTAKLKMDVIHELLHWQFRKVPHVEMQWYLELLLDLLLFGRLTVPDQELALESPEDSRTYGRALVRFGRVLAGGRWEQEMVRHFGRIKIHLELTQETIDKTVLGDMVEDPDMRLFVDSFLKERERLK